MATLETQYQSIAQGRPGDPFALLGPHGARKTWTLRSWQPQAEAVDILGADDEIMASMQRVHADGLFVAQLPLPVGAYRLRLHEHGPRFASGSPRS